MPYPVACHHGQRCRRRWRMVGQVQGVGLRPFVYRLACRYQLSGFVLNDSDGVTIEAQGTADQIERFAEALLNQRPGLAKIDRIRVRDLAPQTDQNAFVIRSSRADVAPSAQVTVDTATCSDCLAELMAPADRRFGYGLINCTHCGPRYTIIRRVPYDRPNTTMASFGMCDSCRAQYSDPADRRFHAQPIACGDCGPKIQLVDQKGRSVEGDPIRQASARLADGQVVAIKGLGGFHLAVRCDDQDAVRRLRQFKRRDAKPFAMMCRDIAEAQRWVSLSQSAIQAMRSPACPIILAPRRVDAVNGDAVAPANHRLGVMLPATPIQHLLFAQQARALGSLVMTSGNVSDEPLVFDNADALERLGGRCEAILWHDRPIQRPVDDSVLIDMGIADPLPIRRARGFVPSALQLPIAAPTGGLCVGGQLKNTVALVRGDQAFLSQHLGDLTHPLALAGFKTAIEDLGDLLGVEPKWIAHDLHPAYLSTSHALRLADRLNMPLIGIQHHHAHAAAVMAEHGVDAPVLAVVCDGVGYGTDGTAWGGELLLADLMGFKRLVRLRPMVLPGGDAAAKDTRRCGLALLYQALGDDFDHHWAVERLVSDPDERRILVAMTKRAINCTISSSAGRLFDGVAALLGLCRYNHFEAQAAMSLESTASQAGSKNDTDEPLFLIRSDPADTAPKQIDLSPLVRVLLEAQRVGRPIAQLAALFHDQLAAAWDAAVAAAAERTGVRRVVLSGGVFCNQRLTERLTARLLRRGLVVLRHRLVPPNDGGLSLGQAAIAAARIKEQTPCV